MTQKEYRLAFDISRCSGYAEEECDNCLRRLAEGNPIRQSYIDPKLPSKNTDGKCPYKIGVDS